MSSKGVPLSQLEASIDIYSLSDGRSYQCILMDCPLDSCSHSILIPFSDEGGRTSQGQAVWKRVGGTTVDDITLMPSYRIVSSCPLHGWIRNGQWFPA